MLLLEKKKRDKTIPTYINDIPSHNCSYKMIIGLKCRPHRTILIYDRMHTVEKQHQLERTILEDMAHARSQLQKVGA